MNNIGIRAAKEIYNRQDSEHDLKGLLNEIGLRRESLWAWGNGKADPCAYRLRVMALAGYDIHYILTGERKKV